ncbi:hypothetical protein [Microbacterium dextranolyticum]|uniref:Uncharacterized protein n=1 Tax=Microbacterium dextranolyticum TaxID=36806 RepID=A0A9W6HJS5_9MICO|nr:hypothetical protein [Microbacterium dextranolyticum]MBM7461851.1 hypothetical protein [Microbacterium dextranolyticum]GLJ94092.1 hypothetical protein GCM10017591_01530 [Microbacterium dextranolyticum]
MWRRTRGIRTGLAVVAWFELISCLIGAVLGVFFGGAGVPDAWLDDTPFTSFVVPGLILGVVVGGAQALALVAHHRRLRLAPGLHVAAGLVMMTWIFAEIALLQVWSPLQGLYFATGLVQVALAVLALGAWPRPFFARDPE